MESGPAFVTEPKTWSQPLTGDLDLSRCPAAYTGYLCSVAPACATLSLRYCALTRDANNETGTPMLMASSGHTSGTVAGKVRKVSAEALAAHQ